MRLYQHNNEAELSIINKVLICDFDIYKYQTLAIAIDVAHSKYHAYLPKPIFRLSMMSYVDMPAT